MTTDPLPRCLKCGGEPMLQEVTYGMFQHFSMRCHDCGASTGNRDFSLQAIQEWKRMNGPDENEWVTLRDPNHVIRECDWLNHRTGGRWNRCSMTAGYKIHNYPDYNFRCRRKDLPPQAEPVKPEPPQNKYVGHICRLRNGDVTDGPVERRKGGGYCLSAKHKGVLRSWNEHGLHDESKPADHPLNIVGIVKDQKPVHPMCAAMAQADKPIRCETVSEFVAALCEDNGDTGSLKMEPAGGPGYAGLTDLKADLLTVTCPVTGEMVKLTVEGRKFFSPWMNPDGTFKNKVPVVPMEECRFMQRDEPVFKGDLFWNINLQEWRYSSHWMSHMYGKQGTPTEALGPYIRKINDTILDNGDNPNCGPAEPVEPQPITRTTLGLAMRHVHNIVANWADHEPEQIGGMLLCAMPEAKADFLLSIIDTQPGGMPPISSEGAQSHGVTTPATPTAAVGAYATVAVCAFCGQPAGCFGQYADHDKGFACDECCGHGNEDGWCVDIETLKASCIPVAPPEPVADAELPELTAEERAVFDAIPADAVSHWKNGEMWDGSKWVTPEPEAPPVHCGGPYVAREVFERMKRELDAGTEYHSHYVNNIDKALGQPRHGGDLLTNHMRAIEQLEAVLEAATAVIKAASIGDQQFISCLRIEPTERTTRLRAALVALGDVLREV
jgi:hypothetical protein